jgi:hypothetical protein
MYREIDFTQLGGYPLDQDTMDFLQGAYKNSIEQLAGVAVSGGAPVVLSGMAVSNSGNTVTDGWLLYNGEIVPFTGGTVTPSAGQVALVQINTVSSTLTYNDGSTPTVVFTKDAVLVAGASATTATTFPVSAMLSYVVSLGLVGRESAWNVLSLSHSASGFSGSLKYKLNSMGNMLYYSFSGLITTPTWFDNAPAGSSAVVGTLPVGYRPANGAVLIGKAQSSSGWFVPLTGGGYVNTAGFQISGADGLISIQFAKTTGVTNVGVSGFGVIPLD